MGWPLDLGESINDGLVGYWYMPEGSGNKVFDLSGNGLFLDFVNSPTWVGGNFGSGIDFELSSSQGLFAAKAVLTSAPMTMIAWVKVEQLPSTPSSYFTAVAVANSNTVHFLYLRAHKTTNTVQACVRDAAGVSAASSDGVITLGKWQQWGAIFESSTSRYAVLDGKIGTQDTADHTPGGVDNTTVGCLQLNSVWADFMDGIIDHVTIYNRALSASEIALLYRFPFYGFMNPDEIPVLGSFGIPPVGMAGAMTTNSGYWGW